MHMHARFFFAAMVLCLSVAEVSAQGSFVPNAGQWNSAVLFQSDVSSGRAFLREDGVRFSFYDAATAAAIHERLDSVFDPVQREIISNSAVKCHAYDVTFLNAGAAGVSGTGKQKATASYFIGNDESKWKGALPMYSGVTYSALYAGIDLVFYNRKSSLKYDFILEPGADASQIALEYTGQRSIALNNGALEIGVDFTTLREIIPEAYQIINGVKRIVKCEYRLNGNTVSFVFPEGYDETQQLIIDPEVVASTYNGGTAMSFGFTATYDDAENIYVGGIVFAQGYPVTPGAYDVTFDSVFDMGFSKFDPAGSNLISCTYVGGVAEDYPLSMYVHQGSLYVYGKTKSSDFPTTAGAFDQSHGGMFDITVFRMSADLSILLGSTFVGASGDDGVNYNSTNIYDGFRGEIIVGTDGTVYVVSGSNSQAFPATPGAYCTTHNGGVDAVVFRMDATLSTMLWATFLGGSQNDSGMGLRVDKAGNVYITGGARNLFNNWPVFSGGYQPNFGGGATDAFVAKFDPTGASITAFTFFGGGGVDHGYFIDLDADGDVYLLCNYLGAPVTPGVYSNPGSENCIARFDPSLSSLIFSTVIGDGTSAGKIVPSAFMVDNCKRIFVGGFGGSQNWPLTDDALYSTWNGHTQWYLAALTENAGSLLYSTFYGSWHVDGGTSRFDPRGIVYQAVCADSSEFPVTPWAYADGTNTDGWSICAFKIDFEIERDVITLPNVFTPNNDGINDVYDVGLSTAHFYEHRIYDRWGIEMFSTNDLASKWDGTYNGRECAEGVYYVIVKHGYCSDEPYENTTFVHLVR